MPLNSRNEGPNTSDDVVGNRPISVYRSGQMPIQSCGQSISASRGKAGARLNAHTVLRAKRQRSARGAIYRNRPIGIYACPYDTAAHEVNAGGKRALFTIRFCAGHDTKKAGAGAGAGVGAGAGAGAGVGGNSSDGGVIRGGDIVMLFNPTTEVRPGRCCSPRHRMPLNSKTNVHKVC